MSVTLKTKLFNFCTEHGREPFIDWVDDLDIQKRNQIFQRLPRIETDGHFGDVKSVGENVMEIRIKNGLRIYYGFQGNAFVLLLGGNKSSQKRDIKTVKQHA